MMPESVSVILHFNVDYAEIPRKELPTVVKTSYRPMINAIKEWSDGTICLNLTGHTIEFLQSRHPKLLSEIRMLVDAGVVDILATGYSHPILPLLPPERMAKQVADHVHLVEELFGHRPRGVWPPELAVSPQVLKTFLDHGLEWVAIDHEHYELARTLGNSVNLFERREPTTTETYPNESTKRIQH